MRLSISNLALRLALPVALALAADACAGNSPDPMLRQCTKQLYESCITEHDCTSQDCRSFAEGYQICTQGCDATTPCPDLNGTPVTCTANACKPPSPIECQVIE